MKYNRIEYNTIRVGCKQPTTVEANLFLSFLTLFYLFLLKNVLEGIGLLVKRGKNHVSWNENPPETAAQVVAEGMAAAAAKRNGTDGDSVASPPPIKVTNPKKSVKNSVEYEEMKKKLETLKEEERNVDRYLEYLKDQAAVFNGRQPPSREQLVYLPAGVNNVPEQMYVKFEDITNMEGYKSETVIGIRAPTGTSLEVPDPDQGMKPGERRYEMYLNSKGTEHPSMRGSPESKGGEPINVYLVQPRADKKKSDSQQQQGEGEGEGQQVPGVVQETPSPQRSSSKVGEESKASAKIEGDERSDQRQPLSFRPHSSGGHSDRHNMYDMPPPPGHGGEYGHEGDRHRKDMQYHSPHGDPSWGGPPPYGHGGTPPPPGYYPPHHHMERGGDLERDYRPPRGGETSASRPPPGREDAFRPHSHHYHQLSHEMGRTASSGGDEPQQQGPSSQQHLLTMPLQSPSEPFHHFSSPSGFTPPRARERVHTSGGDIQFPVLSLTNDSAREYNEGWQPPHPKISKGPKESRR